MATAATHPSTPVICTKEEWREALDRYPLGTLVHLRGELRKRCASGAHTDVLLPAGGGIESGLEDIGVEVSMIDPRTTARLRKPGPAQLGKVCLVSGRTALYPSGNGRLLDASVLVSDEAGPTTLWRAAQARIVSVDTSRKHTYSSKDVIVTEVRGRPGALVWLGRASTDAFKDAVRGERKIRAALTVLGCPSSGPDIVTSHVGALDALPDDTQLAIISRGGGGVGDLNAFNDARLLAAVQRAVARGVPVVSAVGHFKDGTQEELLINRVATYSLAVPTDTHQVLRNLVYKNATFAEREREHSQVQTHRDELLVSQEALLTHRTSQEQAFEAELAALRREIAALRLPDDLRRRDLVVEETRRRLTQVARVKAVAAAVVAVPLGLLFLAWHLPLVGVAALLGGACAAVFWASSGQRLAPPPTWGGDIEQNMQTITSLQEATTVGRYNAVVAGIGPTVAGDLDSAAG